MKHELDRILTFVHYAEQRRGLARRRQRVNMPCATVRPNGSRGPACFARQKPHHAVMPVQSSSGHRKGRLTCTVNSASSSSASNGRGLVKRDIWSCVALTNQRFQAALASQGAACCCNQLVLMKSVHKLFSG